MSDGSDKKPVSAWRLARRILGYGRRYYTVLILMFVVMAALAVVDRGRALVVMPLSIETSDTVRPVGPGAGAKRRPSLRRHGAGGPGPCRRRWPPRCWYCSPARL